VYTKLTQARESFNTAGLGVARPNGLCTPHLGYAERGSYEALYTLVVDQLLAFAAGQPINVVNPEAIGRR
jgi:phosphoglycerate dehydrogenase-like enzyme